MLKQIAKAIFNKMGYEIIRKSKHHIAHQLFISDIYREKEFKYIYEKCKNYTMTSIGAMYSLYKATEYIAECKIPGDMVECGVWRGGSAMIMALTLMRMGETGRKIYLYDTYEGMSEPTDHDISHTDEAARDIWLARKKEEGNEWCRSSFDEVRNNLFSTGYAKEDLIFVKGKVEDTIPDTIPDKISILRLDTDWYRSTYHGLCHLFPRLSKNGVIILDDYGTWEGAKEAVDKYFVENGIKILLNRTDNGERCGIKL